MDDLGKTLVVFGIALVLIGGALVLLGKFIGGWQLPGDITIQRDGFSCFFPLATSIILSIVLTLALNILLRIINK